MARTKTDYSSYKRYWDEERETLAPKLRDRIILERVQHQLQYAYHKLPFYRRHYDANGFHPDQVRTLEDFTTKVPVVTKQMLVEDQVQNPPFGSYGAPSRKDLARIHGSSGTTGRPTMYGVSRNDWERAGQASAAGLWCAGLRPHHLVQITFPFTLFFGGWGNLQGIELLGAGCFPTGTMIPTDQQIEFMQKLGVDVLVATPSYLMHLGHRAAELGMPGEAMQVELAMVGGEPGGSLPAVRKMLSELWDGASIVDGAAGSSSEMYPFITNVGCHENTEGGVHLFQDENYTEIVSREDPNVPVPAGTPGVTVGTHLWRESQPMIRFWMGDESVLDEEPCPCGRTYPRLPRGVFGRVDDMLVIRGANVYPSAVEAAIRSVPGAGNEFRIMVDRRGDLDDITVVVERQPDVDPARVEDLRAQLAAEIRRAVNIRVPVEIAAPGTYEQQSFKARRVVDRRTAPHAELDRARKMLGDVLTALPADAEPTIEDFRRAFGGLFANFTLPDDAETTDVDANGVPATWVKAPGARDDRVLIHLHGGGFCLGSAEGYLPFGYRLSEAFGGAVLLVDYRLAPEHPYPAAIEDAVAAYRYVLGTGVAADHVLIAGDSAGGALAVGLGLSVRDANEPEPAGIVLFSPVLDLAAEAESMTSRAELDPLVSAEMITTMADSYLAGRDPKHTPLASPMHAELGGLPPALVFVGTAEVVHDDATRFADQVRTAGGEVELVIERDMIHTYPVFDFLPEAKEALRRVGLFARTHIGPA
ncbi:alpha/beta hydrolase fold domain-containing protein [Mycolicibacterium sp. XJ1819]